MGHRILAAVILAAASVHGAAAQPVSGRQPASPASIQRHDPGAGDYAAALAQGMAERGQDRDRVEKELAETRARLSAALGRIRSVCAEADPEKTKDLCVGFESAKPVPDPTDGF